MRVRRETPDVVTLVLDDADDGGAPFDFRPGQFFTLVVDIDGRPVRRAYSASSAPGSPQLEVTVKHVEGGRFSSHVHRDLRAGDRLAVRGPSGSFHIRPPASGDIVLVAAGSGVTPMMSMIRTRLAARTDGGRTEGGRTALLYSSRTEQDVIFADELRRLEREHPDRFSVTHVLTCRDRRLDADRVRRWVTELSPDRDAHYYICGPEPLIGTVRGALTGLGIPEALVHHELYTSAADLHPRAADPATAPAVPWQMAVEQDGQPVATVLVEPGQTLLDAGLTAGLPMPYSCTVGNCGECVVKLRAGQVAQHEPNCLTPRQQADGYVLTCVGRPMSKVTVDIADP